MFNVDRTLIHCGRIVLHWQFDSYNIGHSKRYCNRTWTAQFFTTSFRKQRILRAKLFIPDWSAQNLHGRIRFRTHRNSSETNKKWVSRGRNSFHGQKDSARWISDVFPMQKIRHAEIFSLAETISYRHSLVYCSFSPDFWCVRKRLYVCRCCAFQVWDLSLIHFV